MNKRNYVPLILLALVAIFFPQGCVKTEPVSAAAAVPTETQPVADQPSEVPMPPEVTIPPPVVEVSVDSPSAFIAEVINLQKLAGWNNVYATRAEESGSPGATALRCAAKDAKKALNQRYNSLSDAEKQRYWKYVQSFPPR